MIKSRVIGAIVGAVLALSSAACAGSGSPGADGSGSGSSASGSTWKIGQVGSFTGPAATVFAEEKAALSAWASSVNDSGGINGHQIELVQIDDAANPTKSMAAVRQLVETDQVIALVDSSLLDTVWASYIEQNKVPVVGAALFSGSFGSNPYFFPNGTTYAALQRGLAEAAKREGATNLGIACLSAAPQCAETQKYFTSIAPSVGIKVGYTAGVDPSAPNYTPQCLGASEGGVDVMYVGTPTEGIFKLYADCAKQGFTFKKILTFWSVQNSFLDNPQADGLVSTSMFTPLVDGNPPAEAFKAAMAKYAPSTKAYGGHAQGAYTSGLLFAAAANAGKLGDNPTRQQVLDGLYALKDETLGGMSPPLTFKQGEGHKINCYFTVRIENGKFVAPKGTQTDCVPSS